MSLLDLCEVPGEVKLHVLHSFVVDSVEELALGHRQGVLPVPDGT